MNMLGTARQRDILMSLASGMSIRATSQRTRTSKDTVWRLAVQLRSAMAGDVAQGCGAVDDVLGAVAVVQTMEPDFDGMIAALGRARVAWREGRIHPALLALATVSRTIDVAARNASPEKVS